MRIIKLIKAFIVGSIAINLCLCCILPARCLINEESYIDISEQILPPVSEYIEVSEEYSEYSETEESEESDESIFTEETSEDVSEPELSQDDVDEDIITNMSVRLYNDFSVGFNRIDGEVYIRDIAALLTKYAPKGLRISAGCAMAYTEGGAGKYGIYVKTNNCFGIMATSNWDGWVYSRTTGLVYKNFETAKRYGAKGLFRAYPTIEESVRDYIKLIQGDRYNAVLMMDSDADYFNHVLQRGYGEEHMSGVWLAVVQMYDLTQYNIDWTDKDDIFIKPNYKEEINERIE